MKSFSSFFPQDGIVLEELNLSLNERRNISFQHQTGDNNFGNEGCVQLVEGLKKNKSLKKLGIGGISSITSSFTIFSGCGIKDEGMKLISSFLSQDGIVLEELDLGLKEKKNYFISTSNRIQLFWRWRLYSSCWRIEKEQNIEKIESYKHFFKQLLCWHFSGCGITFEGMKAISSYLSQDGIVLEELDLGLKEKKKYLISTSNRL